MKNLLHFIFNVLFIFILNFISPQTIFAQPLTGIKTIPGSYSTLYAAITDLNLNGVGPGGVTFNIAAGYTETFFENNAGTITATGTSANPIIFQKTGFGTNPLITAYKRLSESLVDGIIKIAGGDYITFKSINLRENPLNIFYTDWGYAIVKASADDGAQYINITNCTVTLNKTNTAAVGIYGGNHTALNTTDLITTSAAGANKNININGCTISNVNIGIQVNGAYSNYLDMGLEIGTTTGNTIFNYGGGNFPAYGISIYGQSGPIINNNIITMAEGSYSLVYGIHLGTRCLGYIKIDNNIITVSSSGALTSTLYAIDSEGQTTYQIDITNNTIQNCSYTTGNAGDFYVISERGAQSGADVNITGNTISGITYSSSSTNGSGYVYAIYKSEGDAAAININNNIITGVTMSGPSANTFKGIYIASSCTTQTCNDNQIYGVTIDGPGTSGSIYGIHNGSGTIVNNNNIIHTLRINKATSTGSICGILSPASETYNNTIYDLTSAGVSSVYGIYSFSTTGNQTISYNDIHSLSTTGGTLSGLYVSLSSPQIYKNRIYGLSNSGVGGDVSGIYVTSNAINYIYNNFISDLTAPSCSTNVAIAGIYLSGGTTDNLYFNTIYINASSSNSGFGTAGIYATTFPTVEMRNNIVVNKSIPGNGMYGAKTAAFRRSSAVLTKYTLASNNNLFYAGTPDSARVIYFDGGSTPASQTMAAYKTVVSPRDSSSFSENPPFLNVSSTPYDLHMNIAAVTQVEKGGRPVTTPAITDDYDGDTRNDSRPDVGADEFTRFDVSPPIISYTPLGAAGNYGARTLVAEITDSNGVPATAPGWSTLYWKINAGGTWTAVFPINVSGSQYTYSFGAGVTNGDSVYYYIVAQDNAIPPNVAAYPSIGTGGFTINPPAAATPPTTPSKYKVLITALAGDYTVGAGGNYPTITAAVADLNLRGVSGATRFLLTNTAYTTEALPITIDITSSDVTTEINTLKILPAPGVTATISGSTTTSVIKLNGADYITIDGSNNGTTSRNLTISNTGSSVSTYVIHNASKGIGAGAVYNTIKNCNIKNNNNFGSICIYASGDDNDNLTITNNSLSKAMHGIYAYGTSQGVNDTLVITNNLIGSTAPADYISHDGIMVSQGTGGNISGNTVFNIISPIATPVGITIDAGFVNASITKNDIHNVTYSGTSGSGGRGIYINTGSAASNLSINNNLIYTITGDGYISFVYSSPVGIFLTGTTGGLNIYYNSIYMNGNTTHSGIVVTTCIYIAAATVTAIDLRNNIFHNDMVDTYVGGTGKNYAIYSLAPASSFTDINYNDYYTPGDQGILGYIGGADITTLAEWKAATAKDFNSLNVDPKFIGVSNLHIDPVFNNIGNKGFYLASVPTDYDGNTRNASTPDIGADEYTFIPPTAFPLSVIVMNGWNMVSVPGMHPVNQNVDTWWANRNQLASVYKWSGSYLPVTSAAQKEGYWMLHNGTMVYNTGDEWPAGGIHYVAHDPIPLTSGWNMIGAYESSVPVAGLTTTPPGMIVPGTVYGWSGSYYSPANLEPGYGYWVLANGAGVINIAKSNGTSVAKEDNKETWGKIIVTDASGKKFTLYSVNGEVKVNLDSYQLPPLPPAGCFDVRFGTGRKAEYLSKGNQTIEMAGMEYPVTVMADNIAIKIQDETGRIINKRIKAGEEVKISDSNVSKLLVSENLIPDVYSLDQNYPNPFNPGTLIQFTLPEDVKNVSLIVYDALGQKVTELVSEAKEAGYYQYQWNANNFASGLYIYQLRTEKFISTKKMMLLK